MLLWHPIAPFDEVERARRALWEREEDPADGAYTLQATEQQIHRAARRRPGGRPDAPKAPQWPGRGMRYLQARIRRGDSAPPDDPPRRETSQGSSEGAAKQVQPMAKYLSREWVAAGRGEVESDPVFRDRTQGIHASILCVIHEQPEHADEVFYIDFRDGRILDLYTGDRASFEARGVTPTFEVHGDYDTFMQIQEGHLSQATALMRGRLRLRGSLLKAMKYMRALETVTDILRRVPTEY